MKATSSHSAGDALRSRTRQPRRRCRHLEPRQRVDRDGVRLDAGDVAERGRGAALVQERADPVAEPGKVFARDRAPDRERDRLRGRGVPSLLRRVEDAELIAAATDEFRRVGAV